MTRRRLSALVLLAAWGGLAPVSRGVRASVPFTAPADSVSVVFVLDTSVSVQEGRLERPRRVAPRPENFDQLLAAARLILAELRPDDETALITFADRISLVVPAGPGPERILSAMTTPARRQPPAAYPKSTVYDALIAAAGYAARRGSGADGLTTGGRTPRVVLLSDGTDNASWATAGEAIAAARAFGVTVDLVKVPRTYETYDQALQQDWLEVDPLAEDTGGASIPARDRRLPERIRSLVGSWRLDAASQGLGANDRERVRAMLRSSYEVVKKEYYDPAFHGLDWDARYESYQRKLDEAASLNAAVTTIAAFLSGLDDSHTTFLPPARPYDVDYGYRLKVIGDAVFVTAVTPGSDAASKVHPGDLVLAVNGGPVNRATFHTMRYVLGTLSPQPSTRLRLRDPDGGIRDVTVDATVTPGRQLRDLTGSAAGAELDDLILRQQRAAAALRSRVVEQGDVTIWRMQQFIEDEREIDALVDTARAHASLILDLRGNPGGLVRTLQRVIGSLFDHDVTVGERVTRGGRRALVAPSRGNRSFGGRLLVLVDSASASSSEILARLVQLEHRGTVVGDRSAGAVMEARMFPFAHGRPFTVTYGVSVTSADLEMTDGRSLEHAGVVPDEVRLPAPADLAAGLDPVLAYAAGLAGLDLTPAAAARLFPAEKGTWHQLTPGINVTMTKTK